MRCDMLCARSSEQETGLNFIEWRSGRLAYLCPFWVSICGSRSRINLCIRLHSVQSGLMNCDTLFYVGSEGSNVWYWLRMV